MYHAQGRYGDAEAIYKRSLGIMEKTLGSEHPDIAQVLDNCAVLLRKIGRDSEAARMETRKYGSSTTDGEENSVAVGADEGSIEKE